MHLQEKQESAIVLS